MRALFVTLLGLVCATTALSASQAPESSVRPVARAAIVPEVLEPLEVTETLSTSNAIRPLARPAALTEALTDILAAGGGVAARFARPGIAAAPTSDDLAANTPGVIEVSSAVRSLRPITRPKAIVQKAMARQREAQAGRAGGIQGVQGEAVGAVAGRGACGIENALRVTAVSGVRLSTPALLDVPTARALKAWVDNGLKPAIGNMGGGVASMQVVAHYACRTRNNQPGARLSEHSFGRAIDIAAFTLRNDERIILINDWGRGRKGRALRKMHGSACGTFGTVLGPEANRFHRDHFHFDTARHRGGSYCR